MGIIQIIHLSYYFLRTRGLDNRGSTVPPNTRCIAALIPLILRKKYFLCYLDVSDSDGTAHVRNNFLCIQQPRSTTAIASATCVTRALSYMGVDQAGKLLRWM